MTLLRPLLCALVFTAGIALDWHRLMEALGQGSHAVAAGWFGIPLGAVVITMGLMTPIAGLGVSLVVAYLLRGREPIPAGNPRSLHVHLAALATFPLAVLAVSMAMWRFDTPQTSEYARFGQAFFVTSGLLALSFCIVGAMFTARTLLRQPLLGERT
jgi:hypothetical protein